MAMAEPAAGAEAGSHSSSSNGTIGSNGEGRGGRWKDVPLLPPDPIIDLNRQIRLDSSPNKVDLGIGAYRDDKGQPYILQVVKKAEALVAAEKGYNHEYIPIEGWAPFRAGAQKLMFGAMHEALLQNRVATVQALSGTGALRLGFEFLRRHLPSPVVYLPNQTWGNHRKLIVDAGIADVRLYRYYSPETLALDVEGMLEDLGQAPEGAVVLLHTTGHNPCGFDPSQEEWRRLAGVCKARSLLPFFDNAYQGYTSGSLTEDAFSVRLFASLGLELLCACSFAKNMGLYGERIGALHALCATEPEAATVLSQLKAVVRPMYSSPPAHYAKVAGKILSDEEGLMAEWAEELQGMAARIQRMRGAFLEALLRAQCPGSWAHLSRQKGMFGFTGLELRHVQALKREYSIYLLDNGRISLSGFNEGNVDYVARAFADILSRDPLPCSSSSSSTPAVSAGKGEEPTLLIQPQQVLP